MGKRNPLKVVDTEKSKRNPQDIAKLMDSIHRDIVHGGGHCSC